MSSGTVGVLNVGAGDIKLSFDPANPVERIRAGRIVKDMLHRGYALLVEVERGGQKAYERALDFDEKTGEYIIADYDSSVDVGRELDQYKALAERMAIAHPEIVLEQSEHGKAEPQQTGVPYVQEETAPRKARGRRGKTRVDAASTRATAVGRSAGG